MTIVEINSLKIFSMVRSDLRRLYVLVPALFLFIGVNAQIYLMDVVDTSSKVSVSGYIQPQFQIVQEKGASTSYGGGEFARHSNNRIMLRRGRIRFDYTRIGKHDKQPSLQFVLQLDGTERGVFIRDLWGRVLENKWQLFSYTMGMFARPFGFEVNLSSSEREAPERGRMSQILMKTERDLGIMVTFDARKGGHPLRFFKVDAGIFNGQGLTSFTDFDSHKDFIARMTFKPYKLGAFTFSGGLSYFNGGILQNSRYRYEILPGNGVPVYKIDSSLTNVGRIAPREYRGADMQIKWKYNKAVTEFRAEYWRGRQSAFGQSSDTPDELLEQPYYIRDFDGAFFYFLQTLNKRDQLAVKYDWYDPNRRVRSSQAISGITIGDIKYSTLGFGYIGHLNEDLKLTLWYDVIKNETALLSGYPEDFNDNLFTVRLQFRF